MSGFFLNFFKNIFSIDKKFEKVENFQKIENIQGKKSRFLWFFPNFFFWSIEKIFLKKLRKNPDINTEVKRFTVDRMGALPAYETHYKV